MKISTKQTRRIGRGLALLVAAGFLAYASLQPSANAERAPAGDAPQAPAWSLEDLVGQSVASTDFDGKVLLIDFWATWCPPCRAMIPGLIELHNEYGSRGFVVIGISLDQKGPEVVAAFVQRHEIPYPVFMANEEVIESFGGIRSIPTSFLIDREGRIRERHVGYLPTDHLEPRIQDLL